MKTLIKKVAGLLPLLEERGQVYLFAMGMREDIDRWEVVLSADWSDAEPLLAVGFVAKALVAHLEKTELVVLSGVTVVPSNEPTIIYLPKSLEAASSDEPRFVDWSTSGLNLHNVFIFKARPSSARTNEEALVKAN